METQSTVGERLTIIRNELGFSQKTISEQTKIARSTISKLENDELSDYLDLAMFYNRTSNYSLDWILTGAGEKYTKSLSGESNTKEFSNTGNYNQANPTNKIRLGAQEPTVGYSNPYEIEFLRQQIMDLREDKSKLEKTVEKLEADKSALWEKLLKSLEK